MRLDLLAIMSLERGFHWLVACPSTNREACSYGQAKFGIAVVSAVANLFPKIFMFFRGDFSGLSFFPQRVSIFLFSGRCYSKFGKHEYERKKKNLKTPVYYDEEKNSSPLSSSCVSTVLDCLDVPLCVLETATLRGRI